MNDDVPQGWKAAPFTSVFDIQGGTQPPKKTFRYEPAEGYVRLLQIRDFGDKPVPTFIRSTPNLRTCRADDILIGRYGASVGRICTGMNGAYNVALTKVMIPSEISRRFVFYLLRSPFFQHPILDIERSAQNGFNKEDLEEIVVPIPPLEEQRRIVTKLEKLLDKVNASQQRLTKIPVLLKRFRQSILAAACSGRLTADWRNTNQTCSASELLEEMASTLQKADQLAGDIELSDIDHALLTSDTLPKTWAWAELGFCFGEIKNGTTARQNKDGKGLPITRIETIQNFRFDLKRVQHIEGLDNRAVAAYRYHIGDIAFSHINSFEHVGKTAVYSGEPPLLIHGMNLLRLRLGHELLDPAFVHVFMRTDFFRSEVRKRVGHAINQVSINQKNLSEVPLLIPPQPEQKEIVRRVDELFALADQIEARYAKAKAYIDNLTQSILAKAFRGELVPQDPNDEPASVLLDRIKQQRNGDEKDDNRRKRKREKRATSS